MMSSSESVRAPRFEALFLPRICVLVLGPKLLPAPGLPRKPMIRLFQRAFATVRVWLGLHDPSESRLHVSHGWLLPPPAAFMALNIRGAAPSDDPVLGASQERQ